ncbi:MAG TPA: hypothetical protein VFC78_22260 [Tepidisphaeraceae bacterium]|nr:hypothetical protein [Tepidisphaeraceae bacterium]
MPAINAHEAQAVVDSTGSVHVSQLPFPAGGRVRVLVLSEPKEDQGPHLHTAEELQKSKEIREGLQGSVIRYDRPDDPVALED